MTTVAYDLPRTTAIEAIEDVEEEASSQINWNYRFKTEPNPANRQNGTTEIDYTKSSTSLILDQSTKGLKISNPDAKSKVRYEHRNIANNVIFKAYLLKIKAVLSNESINIGEFVRISERYLLALSNSHSERLFIAGILNVFKFNEHIEKADISYVLSIIDRMDTSNLDRSKVITFIRQIRARGYNASSISEG